MIFLPFSLTMRHKRKNFGSERPYFMHREDRNPTGGHPVPREIPVCINFTHPAENGKLRDIFISGKATKLLGDQATVFATEIIKLILSFRTISKLTDVTLIRKSDTVVSKTKNIDLLEKRSSLLEMR